MFFFSYSTTKAKRIQIEQATTRKILSFFANSVEFGPPGFTEAKRILSAGVPPVEMAPSSQPGILCHPLIRTRSAEF
jgi:hypothetical protein